MRPKYSVISIWHFRAGGSLQDAVLNNDGEQRSNKLDIRTCVQLLLYLDHRQHALVSDGVGANGEVSRGVPTDDTVDGVPVWAVWLIPVHHRQVGHHHVHLVLRHLPRKLQSRREEWRGGEEMKGGWGGRDNNYADVAPAVG